jgi:UTP--glucose-1-phosphate uridylyltransferase
MSQKVTKAVILTAGLGTRFLPVTKVVPKALLPVAGKPVIHLLVEEAVNSGIDHVVIVTSPEQTAIKEYFTHNDALERELNRRQKSHLTADLNALVQKAHLTFVVQTEALGDGHAILQAKEHIKGDHFAVLFGDDLILGEKPGLAQLIEVFEQTGGSVIATEEVPDAKIHNYGVIEPEPTEAKPTKAFIRVKSLVEKPPATEAPSNLGVIGKYACHADVLPALEKSQASHADGEVRLIDGLITSLQTGSPIYACKMQGNRYDTGTPEGYLHANIAFAKQQS